MFPRPGRNGFAGSPAMPPVVLYAYNVTVSLGLGTPLVPAGAPSVSNILTAPLVNDVSVKAYPSAPELL